eukprot:gene6340-18890_t
MLFIDTLKETAVVGRLIILADTIDVSLDIVQSVIWLNNGNVHAVVLMLSSIIAYVTSRGFDYHLAQHYDLTNNENWSNEQYGHPMTAADIATSWRVQMKEARRSFYLHGWIFEASALSLAFYFSADAATSFSDQPVLAKINVVSTFVQLAIVVLNWLRVYGRNCEAKEQGSDAEYSYCYYFLFVVFSVALTVGFFVHQSVNPNVDPTFGVAACTLLQLKFHNNDCESTALFGVNNLCPSCGKGILCTHHGCKEGGRRRHKKWCKIGKKRGAKKRDGADQTLGKGSGGGSGGGRAGGGGGAAAPKHVRDVCV